MCWSETASFAMVGLGAGATGWTLWQGRRWPIPAAIGYFTVMEALQAAGYMVVDECADPANQSLTLLSYLHIAFQPFLINAFAMELVPDGVRRRIAGWVYAACGVSTAVMLMQLYPFDWAGDCTPGSVLCGVALCLNSGDWHIAWSIPYNGLMHWAENLPLIGSSFPTYVVTVFLVPFLYGAWRFVVFHLLAGPVLATMLTSNPNEMPAIWCLFSIGILLIGMSPAIRARFACDGWGLWPERSAT